jgi:hypothetical protein
VPNYNIKRLRYYEFEDVDFSVTIFNESLSRKIRSPGRDSSSTAPRRGLVELIIIHYRHIGKLNQHSNDATRTGLRLPLLRVLARVG